jgi:hypothetical protein
MTQLTLFPIEKEQQINSRCDVAAKLGISIGELCDLESRINDRFYGITYHQRMELVFCGLNFPWLKIEDPIPEQNRDWCKVYQDWREARLLTADPPPTAKFKRQIGQWSIDAKRRLRLNKLHDRLRQKYSIPDLFHAAIGREVLRNPNYYGVCVLPSEFACNYTPALDPRQQAAIARENKLRVVGI